ncbi:MAG: DegV family protein [Lachnospiraceae bacterium]|nr:DegV family protein [Lachnospiraceae bacterium]
MKAIGIVTDSHSSISQQRAKELGIKVLPMPFYIGEDCYYEDVSLTRDAFFEKLDSGADIATSQPSPADVMQIWDEALKEYEQILYIPLSSGLSGSCATASAMAQDEPYENRVFVVDNGRVSVLMERSILDALELIQEGYSAKEIKEILEQARDRMVIYIGVQTLEHLKKGGRITPATAALGTILQIKPVLKLGTETLDTFKKCRGFAKAKAAMLEAIRHDLDTTFRQEYEDGQVYLMAATSASPEERDAWLDEIKAAFPDMELLYGDLSLGVSCHIGFGGLGIGLSCRPKRPSRD